MALGLTPCMSPNMPSDSSYTDRELQSILEQASTDITTLERLSHFLDAHKGFWPVFDLIVLYQSVYNALPEDAKSGRDDAYRDSIEEVVKKVKTSYRSLDELLTPDADTLAILNPNEPERSISHRDIYQFVHSFNLGLLSVGPRKPRIVVALPSGTTMGLACLAVATYYTMAPMTPSCGAEQFRADVERVQATAILVSEPDAERLKLRNAAWILESGINVFIVEDRKDKTLTISSIRHSDDEAADQPQQNLTPAEPNSADDIAILLFTSGTSGTKKLVPITTHTLVAGVAFVIKSWGLTQEDRCLNMMPLHHIGGIIRNLFAPVMAGGSTICSSSFDPNLFWDLVEGDQGPTWYYASPSMHAAILSEAKNRPDSVSKSRIRLVCNAAGGLLPTLATQLRDTFTGCTVLPSYGMTECMPIATPPLTYCLDRPGTSGVSVGPEISIQDPSNNILSPGLTGNICVRGLPVFPGYLKDNDIDQSAFTESGWFDTGDMGYLDEDGYLYITGRSKEVINRGGEILSPFEIEEAILSASKDPESIIHGRVSETLAFSMPHDVLQEVVGAVLVVPNNKPRPSLEQLHEAVRSSLHQSKWPVVIVYMTSLPKAKNKVLRIKLSERLDMTSITDSTNAASRYYEAVCPPEESDLAIKIPNTRCDIDCGVMASKIKGMFNENTDVFVHINKSDGLPHAIVFGDHGLADADATEKKSTIFDLQRQLREETHGYLVPKVIRFMNGVIPLHEDGSINESAIEKLWEEQIDKGEKQSQDSSVQDIIDIFASVLSCSPDDLNSETDFFAAGGDSLGAGRLLSMLRKQFQIRLSIETLFSNPTVGDVANLVESALAEQHRASEKEAQLETDQNELPECTKAYSSTSPLVLLLHALPITILYPLRLALWWTLFLYGMAELPRRFPLASEIEGRLLILVLIMVGCTTAVGIIAPVFGIMVKWIVIGRHKEGLYPMWACYHNRWWFTQKTLQVCGKGIFDYSAWSRTTYYRLLGAKIGRNVIIHETAQLGEYDLIEIGDSAILDRHCICRPFAVETNTSMLLSRISIGQNCTIGLSSIIVPGTVLPANTCIGPNSSTWEMDDANENNRDLVATNLATPHWILRILIIEPVALLAWLVGRAPWLAGLIGLVRTFPRDIWPDHAQAAARWYTNTKRIGFHYIARIGGDTIGPITLFLFVLLVKRLMDSRWICGPLKSGTPMKNRSQMQKLRTALLQRLVPEGDLSKVASLFGAHYEIVSILVRALGGRVGQRVYWPGVGPSMQDFELLDIGNDVVFGSRAHLVTSNQIGSDAIALGDGCMVADRVVVQPGTTVGEHTVLGSGALTCQNGSYPSNTVWIGSKAGNCICLNHKSHDDTDSVDNTKSSTPFGRAFYQGKADYHVLGLPTIICYSLLTTICVSLYWNTSTILGMKVIAVVLQLKLRGFHKEEWYRPFPIYALLTASIAVITTLQAILALVLIVGAKWSLMGRRSPGSYDWDKNSYCQRWQILLTIERLRRKCYGGVGILGLLTGTHYAVLYFRALGGSIGRDCALFANGTPSLLFTEPDLLTLGDRVAVDDASLVSHINSRGQFKLNRLYVGDRSALRTGSRLLSGASIGEDACLLEHTLIVAGDHVEAGDVYQGWPGTLLNKKRF